MSDGRVFPSHQSSHPDARGISLRDFFAAMALHGILSRPLMYDTGGDRLEGLQEGIARFSYQYADKMLAERSKG